MKEQSTSQRREATTPVKLVAADVLLSRKNEIQNVIARRAYELFKGHGSVNGRAIDDWIEAEVEVVRTYRSDLRNRPRPSSLRPNCHALLQLVNSTSVLNPVA